jgi:hypothetical protein
MEAIGSLVPLLSGMIGPGGVRSVSLVAIVRWKEVRAAR